MRHKRRHSRRYNTIQHEAWKQQMAKLGRSGTYLASTNPSTQGISKKCGGIQHYQDQDAPTSGVSHIRDLRTKNQNV